MTIGSIRGICFEQTNQLYLTIEEPILAGMIYFAKMQKRNPNPQSQIIHPAWFTPIFLLGLCVVTFGIVAPRLGFYWDDWAKTLVHRLHGLNGYWSYYAEDRPISGWTHILLISLIGDKPLHWQFLSVFLRWLSGVGVWWSMRILWPQQRFLSVLTASLFLVNPVFTQQAAAVTFHQQWLQYCLYFLSIGLMILAFRNRPRFLFFTAFSLVCMLLELTITEYFIGLELLRFLILAYLVRQERDESQKRSRVWLRHSFPYGVVAIGYIIFRLFLIPLPGEDPYAAVTLFSFFKEPRETILSLFWVVIRDFSHMLVSSWYQSFEPGDFIRGMPRFSMISWGLAGLVTVGSFLYYSFIHGKENPHETDSTGDINQVITLGAFAILLGALPAWITGREVVFDFHSNRYAQPAMFGLSLFLAGVLGWFITRKHRLGLFVAILVGLGAGFHLRVQNDYRWEWIQQNRFFYQMFWRAPYIQPGTAFLTSREPFPEEGLFSISSAVNLLYPQEMNQPKLAYWVYALSNRYTSDTLPDPLEFGLHTQFRTLVFDGGTPNTILFFFDPSQANCLWLLDPVEDQGDPDLPEILAESLPASNLARISKDVVKPPPADLFGPEPEMPWCRSYQEASLSRQYNDWQNVTQTALKVLQDGYSPSDIRSNSPHEWAPFIQGLAYGGYWEAAEKITLEASEKHQKYKPWLCALWARLDEKTLESPEKRLAMNNIKHTMVCK